MKKLFCALIMMVMLAGAASGEVVGVLAKMNASPGDYQKFLADRHSKKIRTVLRSQGDISCSFYESLTAMLMALNSGRIDSMFLPECTADYILKEHSGIESRGYFSERNLMGLTMGFREDNAELRDKVNSALADMSKDGTSSLLIKRYISAHNTKPVKFEHFNDADTLKIAITGDLPSIDYVDVGGNASGFNTALLAELGRRLHMNIQLVQVEAGARAAALTSGRVDCVFWFAVYPGGGNQWDIPKGVIVTSPYFSWDKNLLLGLKK